MNAVERRGRVAAMTAAGVSARVIAEVLGVTVRTVTRDRAAAGVARPVPDRVTVEQVERMRVMAADGVSAVEIGRTLGVHGRTVARHCPEAVWSRAAGGELGRFVRSMRLGSL